MKTILASVLVAFSLVACSSGGSSNDGPDPTPGASGPIVVTTPSAGDGASVSVRARIEGDQVIAELVARQTPPFSGAAFRLEFPSWLEFTGREVAAGWSSDSKHHEKRVGEREVALVDVRLGKGAAFSAVTDEAVLTTLTWRRRGDEPTGDLGGLRIVRERSELRDPDGKVVSVKTIDASFGRE